MDTQFLKPNTDSEKLVQAVVRYLSECVSLPKYQEHIKGNLTSIGTARHSWHGSPQTKMKKNEILYGCLHEFKFYRERASCGLPGTVRGDEARARGGEVEPEI